MPSNLTSAKHAVAAELSHAKQGLAFYTARVEALETALVQLENVEGETSSSAGSKGKAQAADAGVRRRGRKPREASANANAARGPSANGAVRRGRKPKAAGRAGSEDSLPSTGGDFWLDLISDQPKSAVDIANTAVEKLGLRPDQKDQIQKLKQRVSPALAGLVAAQKIQDSGAGRERRFFKGQGQGQGNA